jgi:small-conductance mechanosensitive channel
MMRAQWLSILAALLVISPSSLRTSVWAQEVASPEAMGEAEEIDNEIIDGAILASQEANDDDDEYTDSDYLQHHVWRGLLAILVLVLFLVLAWLIPKLLEIFLHQFAFTSRIFENAANQEHKCYRYEQYTRKLTGQTTPGEDQKAGTNIWVNPDTQDIAHIMQHYLTTNVLILIQFGLKLFIFGVGLIVALRVMGLDFFHFLTSIGILTLSISWGLKDLISNVFAGIWILWFNTVTIGDIIEILGIRGIVVGVTLRCVVVCELESQQETHIGAATLTGQTIQGLRLPEHKTYVEIPNAFFNTTVLKNFGNMTMGGQRHSVMTHGASLVSVEISDSGFSIPITGGRPVNVQARLANDTVYNNRLKQTSAQHTLHHARQRFYAHNVK